MRKAIYYTIFILMSSIALGQAFDNNMPNLNVPNPEVHSFLKNEVWSNTMNSGLLNLNIPLHTLKLDDKELPINLSYSSSSPSVNERGGVIGIGWDLSNTCRVTRIKNQTPDDLSYGFIHENEYTVNTVDTNCNQHNADCLEAESQFENGLLDLESDKYIVALPFGKGFEFMFNQNRNSNHPFGQIIKFP